MIDNIVICPGCEAKLQTQNKQIDENLNASAACREIYNDLSYYTLSLQDEFFIHQLIVDTYTAQHYGPQVKPITITFALVGLYLVCERNYTGKQVQRIHTKLSYKSKVWPQFAIPELKSDITVLEVFRVSDNEKPAMILKWCQSVWALWKSEKENIAEILAKYQNL